jgi:hypothetical protein
MEDKKHLRTYQSMYENIAKTEEDAGRKGQTSWRNATDNVEAYQKAIDRLNDYCSAPQKTEPVKMSHYRFPALLDNLFGEEYRKFTRWTLLALFRGGAHDLP